jgi:hypothetical protein
MSRVSNSRIAVQQGAGIVVRYGDVAAVLAESGENEFTDALIGSLQSAESQSMPATELAWQLAGLLHQHRGSAPAFAVSAPVSEGQLLLLHGAALAVADEVSVTGRYALTWVDYVLTAPVQTIALTLGEAPAVEPDRRSDLRAGVVPGSGVVITFEPDRPEQAAAAPVVTEPAVEPAVEPVVPLEPPAPLPAPEPPAADALGPATEVMPDATAEPEPEPQPTVATLVADDGARTPLDRPYVFGRDPDRDDAVARGVATGLVVSDPDNAISRVHTYLWVNQHGVYVRDANSANGTFVAAPGARDWDRLGDQPAELPVGWSIRIGRRIFTHVGAQG